MGVIENPGQDILGWKFNCPFWLEDTHSAFDSKFTKRILAFEVFCRYPKK